MPKVWGLTVLFWLEKTVEAFMRTLFVRFRTGFFCAVFGMLLVISSLCVWHTFCLSFCRTVIQDRLWITAFGVFGISWYALRQRLREQAIRKAYFAKSSFPFPENGMMAGKTETGCMKILAAQYSSTCPNVLEYFAVSTRELSAENYIEIK